MSASSSSVSASVSASASHRALRAVERSANARQKRQTILQQRREYVASQCSSLIRICGRNGDDLVKLIETRSDIVRKCSRRRDRLFAAFDKAQDKFHQIDLQRAELMRHIRERMRFGISYDDLTEDKNQLDTVWNHRQHMLRVAEQALYGHDNTYYPRRMRCVNRKIEKKRAQKLKNMRRHAKWSKKLSDIAMRQTHEIQSAP